MVFCSLTKLPRAPKYLLNTEDEESVKTCRTGPSAGTTLTKLHINGSSVVPTVTPCVSVSAWRSLCVSVCVMTCQLQTEVCFSLIQSLQPLFKKWFKNLIVIWEKSLHCVSSPSSSETAEMCVRTQSRVYVSECTMLISAPPFVQPLFKYIIR